MKLLRSARQVRRLPPTTAPSWRPGPRLHRFFVPTATALGVQRHFGWAETTAGGLEAFTLILPEAIDPADWVTTHGVEGLRAFVVAGGGDSHGGEARPVHSGRYLAAKLARRLPLSTSIASLANIGNQFKVADSGSCSPGVAAWGHFKASRRVQLRLSFSRG